MSEEEQLRTDVRQLATNGRANCRQLLDLARRTGASPEDIGRLCNEMNIRISNCQLGCFR
jgi:hypothetical protein